jgi:hypothetical protein
LQIGFGDVAAPLLCGDGGGMVAAAAVVGRTAPFILTLGFNYANTPRCTNGYIGLNRSCLRSAWQIW